MRERVHCIALIGYAHNQIKVPRFTVMSHPVPVLPSIFLYIVIATQHDIDTRLHFVDVETRDAFLLPRSFWISDGRDRKRRRPALARSYLADDKFSNAIGSADRVSQQCSLTVRLPSFTPLFYFPLLPPLLVTMVTRPPMVHSARRTNRVVEAFSVF